MEKKYITITGMYHYHGAEFLERGMDIILEKDHENEYDSEAIQAKIPGIGKIGYVANSVRTVLGESMSGGRLYDKIGETAEATVAFILPAGVICEVELENFAEIEEADIPF